MGDMAHETTTTTTDTISKSTVPNDFSDILQRNSGMIKRALYVTVAVTIIVLLYFVLRFIKARRRKTRRYGHLDNAHTNLEMTGLASDSDEDVTMFDARSASTSLIN